jgi:hypothetical protein
MAHGNPDGYGLSVAFWLTVALALLAWAAFDVVEWIQRVAPV